MNTYKNCCIVIPARYKSTRLPGKPLLNFGNKTLIQIVAEKCMANSLNLPVYVLTDDNRIYDLCEDNNINVLMTNEECLTGTDRIASTIDKLDYDWFINIQGDELFIIDDWINIVYKAIGSSLCEVYNLYSQCSYEQAKKASVPKVVVNQNNELIYISRSLIPGMKDGNLKDYKKQIGVYAFSKNALSVFRNHSTKMALEKIEDIEILRFIELGIKVHMVEIYSNETISIDTLEDYEYARNHFRD